MATPPTDPDRPLPAYYRRIKSSSATAVLGAAMVAVGEILEPTKARVAIEHEADDRGDDALDLDFGPLPSLDD